MSELRRVTDERNRANKALDKIMNMPMPFAGSYKKVYKQMVFDMRMIATEALDDPDAL